MKYSKLAGLYEKLESTSGSLTKTLYISELLKSTKKDDLERITLLLQGKLYPPWDEHKIGVASRLILKTINIATGISSSEIEAEWKKTGDLGKVAENLVARKKQITLFSKSLTLDKVFNNLRKLAELEGVGTVDRKNKLIAELLTSAKPVEAKYIVRTVLEELRVGVGAGTLRDAIAWSELPIVEDLFEDLKAKGEVLEINNIKDLKNLEKYGIIRAKDPKLRREAYNFLVGKVQEAYDLTNDFGIVATQVRSKGLDGLSEVKLEVNRPIKVMLGPKEGTIKDAFKRVGAPAAIEYKYDGFRMQVHGKNGKIILFTRGLENVTKQFPEVVNYLKENVKAESFIFDGEAVGYDPKTKKYLHFQSISQRIRRKYDIEKMSKDFPVELNLFDIVYLDGKDLLKTEFIQRRRLLEKVVPEKKWSVVVAEQIITDKHDEAQKFYEKALDKAMEGVMFKKLDAPYKPGGRVGHMVKMKPVMESLDLIIVGAEWGEGKRASWLTSFTLACIDSNGGYLEIGKVGTGIKELEEEGVTFAELTKMLKPFIVTEKGKEVKIKPKIVIEVNYEEIQSSTTYNSGFALRFPRFIRLRDRLPEDISTLDFVKELSKSQKK